MHVNLAKNGILAPGAHCKVPASIYHADPCFKPSLSSSIAKLLIERTPRHAKCAHPRLNPDHKPKDNSKFDLGSVVHELMLGVGGGFSIITADDYRSKLAQEQRQNAINAGLVPILTDQFLKAKNISAQATRTLKEFGINYLADNFNEIVLIWEEQGISCRAMIDSVNDAQIYDIKTTAGSLSDVNLNRLIANLGYELSAAFYIRGLKKVQPDLANHNTTFTWIFVEIEPPYEVVVMDADRTTLEIGARKVNAAINIWADCMKSGEWPGYPRKRRLSQYPTWAEDAWYTREVTEENRK
jgi:PDDEXK-like uncharacterized protein DUF3799